MTSMYHDRLKNLYTMEASKADNLQGQCRYGLVESYDPDTHRVQCSLLPERTLDGEKILTNWLHILTPWLGPEKWGDVTPFEINDHVLLLPMYGSGSEYVAIGSTFNKTDLPATGPNEIGGNDVVVQVGEKLLKSKSGTSMKFVDHNTLMIKGDWHKEQMNHIRTKGNDVQFDAAAGVHVNNNLTASGNVSAGSGASGTFSSQTGQVITVANGIVISIK